MVSPTYDGDEGGPCGGFSVHAADYAAVLALVSRPLDALDGQRAAVAHLLTVVQWKQDAACEWKETVQ
ncbi:hypothetical protein CEXT_768771 [Caerostris extrusa]|uniref:Uncharacterized protein n=1 Tax=Caerostris extrusa TaxID=172846 RepID=A0AAV4WBZ4_CAEEX|nr:hypothetical protein CEXT_768771 [Caerostris extrusa]